MKSCGWLQYEYEPLIIRHAWTNQSLHLVSGNALSDAGLISCIYSAPNLAQSISIPIEITNVALHKGQGYWFGFRINYNSILSGVPDFASWKFLDEFLIDAVTCWPENFSAAKKFPTLRIEGGWTNGVWNPQLIRLFSFQKDESFLERSQTLPKDPCVPGNSHIEEIWRYVDCERPDAKATLDYECEPPNYVPFLHVDAMVRGFQGKVPYLVTQDDHSYIIPVRFNEVSMGPDAGIRPTAEYIYLNEKYFFVFNVGWREIDLMFVHYYGFRDFLIGREYWPLNYSSIPVSPFSARKPRDIFSNGFVLPYGIWRSCIDCFSNAWSVWRRPSRQVVKDGLESSYVGGIEPQYEAFIPPVFKGGFSAGVRNDRYAMTYCAQPIILPDAAR